MTSREATLEALKGYPISCKYFENPRRFITFVASDVRIDIFDSDHNDPVCFKSLEWKYGTKGWFKFSNKKAQVYSESYEDEVHTTIEVEEGPESFVDQSYLSDQLDEVRLLLEKVLNLADINMKKKGKA